MDSPYVRLARPEELEEVGEITYRAYVPLFLGIPNFDQAKFAASKYGKELRDVAGHAHEADCIAVAVLRGKIVGAVHYYRIYSDGNPGFRKLATDPEVQHHGIAEILVRWCIDRARHEGFQTLALHTTDMMPAAQRLYRRLGFARAPAMDGKKGNPIGFTLALTSGPPVSWATLSTVGRRVGKLLLRNKQTVAVSESACGGLISAALLAVPGASAYFKAAHVAYTGVAQSVYTKEVFDSVRNGVLKYGGEDMVLARATMVAKAFEASWGIAEASQTGPTFIAVGSRAGGPRIGMDGRLEELSAERGEARSWLGVVGPDDHRASVFVRNPGVIDREMNMLTFAQRALELLERNLQAGCASKL